MKVHRSTICIAITLMSVFGGSCQNSIEHVVVNKASYTEPDRAEPSPEHSNKLVESLGPGRNSDAVRQGIGAAAADDNGVPVEYELAENVADLDYTRQNSNAKRSSWSKTNEAWAKRVKSAARNGGWTRIGGAWGKREPGWNNLKGLWGKRAAKWGKLPSAWGKPQQGSGAYQ